MKQPRLITAHRHDGLEIVCSASGCEFPSRWLPRCPPALPCLGEQRPAPAHPRGQRAGRAMVRRHLRCPGVPSALLRHPARPLQAWLKKAAPRHCCPSHGPSVAPKPHAGVDSGEVQDRNSGIQKKFGKCSNCLILLCSPPKLNMFLVHNRLGLEVQAL